MGILFHIALLVIAALLAAAGGGLWVPVGAAAAGAFACFALRTAGGHWVRLATFLTGVSIVVASGLSIEDLGGGVLLFAVLLVVQLGALGSALVARPEDGVSAWPTLAFYAALMAAFLLLSGNPVAWTAPLRAAVAAVAVAAGVFVWRTDAASRRFRKTSSEATNRRLAFVHGLAAFAAVMMAVWAQLARPLPWVGEQVVEAGEGLREIAGSLSEGLFGDDAGEDGEPDEAPEEAGPSTDFGQRRELPGRAELNLGGEAMLHLEIPDAAEFATFVSARNYVRSWVLGNYVDDAWDDAGGASVFRNDSEDGASDGWVRLQEGTGIVHRVYLPSAGGAGLPSIQNPIGFGLGFVLESAPGRYEAELRGAVYYDAESSPLSIERLGRRRILPSRAPMSHLLELPDGEFGRKLRRTAAEITFGAGNPRERLSAISEFLRGNCRYSLRVENPDGLPPLENFLYGERVGWCDFFATAAVLFAREAGFPARMAYGYSGGQSFAEKQVVSYRERDAHAWAEVLVQGVGWTVFDTTPPGSGAARTPEPGQEAEPPVLDDYRDAEDQSTTEPEVADAGQGSIPPWAGWALIAVGVGLVAFIALRIFNKIDDDDPEAGAEWEDRIESSAPSYLREFLRLCREAGRPKPKGETLREAIAGLAATGLSVEILPSVADYHYSVQYEDAPRDRGREGDFRKELRELRKAGAETQP